MEPTFLGFLSMTGPIFDCGSPECLECQRAFPDRTRAIQAAIDCGKIEAPFGWVRISDADLQKIAYAKRRIAA